MKTTNKNAAPVKNFQITISELSIFRILNNDEMRCVRGGEAEEGSGLEPIIIIPPREG